MASLLMTGYRVSMANGFIALEDNSIQSRNCMKRYIIG